MGFYSKSYLYQPSQEEEEKFLRGYSPGFWQMSGFGTEDSFATSTIGLGSSMLEKSRVDSSGRKFIEEQWRNSAHYRPGLKYQEGMTEEGAELLADRYDNRQMSEFMLERSGVSGWFGYITGSIMGAIPDPVNLLPFGFILKGRHMLKLGKLATKVRTATNRVVERGLGRMAMGGFEGGMGALALQPLLSSERAMFQEKHDARSAALDVLVGVGAGVFFAGGMEGVRRLTRKEFSVRGEGDDLTVSARDGSESPIRSSIVRELTSEEQVQAARSAVASVSEGKSPDVAQALPDRAEASPTLTSRFSEDTPIQDPGDKHWYLTDQDGAIMGIYNKLADAKQGMSFRLVGKGTGVYEFLDESGQALYVGKKRSLMDADMESAFLGDPEQDVAARARFFERQGLDADKKPEKVEITTKRAKGFSDMDSDNYMQHEVLVNGEVVRKVYRDTNIAEKWYYDYKSDEHLPASTLAEVRARERDKYPDHSFRWEEAQKEWDTRVADKPDFTAISEPEPQPLGGPKQDEAAIDIEMQRADAEWGAAQDGNPATVEETKLLESADSDAQRHQQVGDAAEEVAACVIAA